MYLESGGVMDIVKFKKSVKIEVKKALLHRRAKGSTNFHFNKTRLLEIRMNLLGKLPRILEQKITAINVISYEM